VWGLGGRGAGEGTAPDTVGELSRRRRRGRSGSCAPCAGCAGQLPRDRVATAPLDATKWPRADERGAGEEQERTSAVWGLGEGTAPETVKERPVMALVHDDADAAAVPDHLLCPVCLEAPPGRTEQCHAGHLICALSGGEPSCLAKLRARAAANGVAGRCPVCRAPLPADMPRCLAAEQSIALLPATCRHCEEGTTRGGLAAHEATCASAPNVRCRAVEGCVWEGRASDRATHEAECTFVDLNRGRLRDGATQLYLAAAKGRADEVARLIAAGVDVDKATRDETTPLFVAARNGHSDVAGQLIAAGADVNAFGFHGATPLHAACVLGRLDVVERLITAGAEVGKARRDGTMPLCVAAARGHAQVVERLMTAGADVGRACRDGTTPLYVAAEQGRAEVVARLIAAGALSTAHTDGRTPLWIAARSGHLDVVVLLITAGADVTTPRSDGTTAHRCTTPSHEGTRMWRNNSVRLGPPTRVLAALGTRCRVKSRDLVVLSTT